MRVFAGFPDNLMVHTKFDLSYTTLYIFFDLIGSRLVRYEMDRRLLPILNVNL
jgi:hypothetical protein